jgi:transcriptional regulator with XRE-family HTH domain
MKPFSVQKTPFKKKKVLSFKQRKEIIEKLEVGISGTSLAEEYGVSESTISKIKQNKNRVLDGIENFVKNSPISPESVDLSSKKSLKTAKDMVLENALLMWFTQQRDLGHPISGSFLKEQALELNKQFNGDTNFKASNGWLRERSCIT